MTRRISSRFLRIGLEQILGKHAPPDLSKSILARLEDPEAGRDARSLAAVNAAANQLADSQAAQRAALEADLLNDLPQNGHQPSTNPPSPASGNNHRRTNRQQTTTLALALGLVLVAMVSVSVILVVRQGMDRSNIAQPRTQPQTIPADLSNSDRSTRPGGVPRFIRPTENLADHQNTPADHPHGLAQQNSNDQQDPSHNVAPPSEASSRIADLSPGTSRPQLPTTDRSATLERPATQVVGLRMREQFQVQWTFANVTPSESVDDTIWASRLFQAVLGRDPNEREWEQIREVLPLDRAATARLLLTSRRYRGQFAKHWGELLAKRWLASIEPRNSSLIAPEAFAQYLEQALLNRQGMDAIFHDLLTAEGNVAPGQESFQPATNFLVALYDEKGLRATQRSLNLLWGTRSGCAKCHDSPFQGGLQQSDFWEINAHFRQMTVQGNQESGVQLVDQDYLGEADDPDLAAVFYETPEKQLVAAYPKYSSGQSSRTSGRVDTFNRRQALAVALLNDPRFEQAVTNSVWRQVFGYPLVPDHEIGSLSDNPDHRILRDLSRDFKAARFDLASLLEWVVLSPPFDRAQVDASQWVEGDAPWVGQRPVFASWYPKVRQFRSIDEGLASLEQAYQKGPQAMLALKASLVNPTQQVDTPQGALADANQTAVDWRLLDGSWQTTDDVAEMLQVIVSDPMTREQKIEHVFLMATGQPPSPGQRQRVLNWLAASDTPLAVYQDVWWALQHSLE